MPATQIPATVRTHYNQLTLTDPKFDTPARLDLLIGGDVFPHLIRPKEVILHTSGLPSVSDTLFGWVVVGSVSRDDLRPQMYTALSVSVAHRLSRSVYNSFGTPKNQSFRTFQLTKINGVKNGSSISQPDCIAIP